MSGPEPAGRAPIAFAHRGARTEAPENSVAAFRRALGQGATGLETDAWLAGDGEVVLTHDRAVWHRLRRLAVNRTSSSRLGAAGVPRLAEVYAACGTDFELSVDAKEARVAQPLIEVARAHGAAHRLWVCHPSLDLLAGLRAGAPDVRLVHSPGRRALRGRDAERHAAALAAAGVDACNLHHTEWSLGLVTLYHRFGVRAFAWDAQETRQLRAVLAMGIDAVYCDRVDRMMAAVGEWALRRGGSG